jgi:hypothetical protein
MAATASGFPGGTGNRQFLSIDADQTAARDVVRPFLVSLLARVVGGIRLWSPAAGGARRRPRRSNPSRCIPSAPVIGPLVP